MMLSTMMFARKSQHPRQYHHHRRRRRHLYSPLLISSFGIQIHNHIQIYLLLFDLRWKSKVSRMLQVETLLCHSTLWCILKPTSHLFQLDFSFLNKNLKIEKK